MEKGKKFSSSSRLSHLQKRPYDTSCNNKRGKKCSVKPAMGGKGQNSEDCNCGIKSIICCSEEECGLALSLPISYTLSSTQDTTEHRFIGINRDTGAQCKSTLTLPAQNILYTILCTKYQFHKSTLAFCFSVLAFFCSCSLCVGSQFCCRVRPQLFRGEL